MAEQDGEQGHAARDPHRLDDDPQIKSTLRKGACFSSGRKLEPYSILGVQQTGLVVYSFGVRHFQIEE